MKVYIACLAAYNNGKLHGQWIDADKGADVIREGIKSVLEQSPENNKPYPCEEWAIHDYDDFPRHVANSLGENPDLDEVCAIAEFLSEHGELGEALLSEHDLDEAKEMLEERYHGEYSSRADFAQDFFESCYDIKDVPEIVRYHIDWDSLARDMFMDGFTDIESGSRIYVFSDR